MNKIKKIQKKLSELNIDGIIIPMSDPFQNDFIPEYYHRVKFLSGFTGSLGTIIILKNSAALFVDGRYTLQAQKQIDTKQFSIENYDSFSMMSWVLKNTNQEHTILGYDAWDYTVTELNVFQQAAPEVDFLPLNVNPVDEIWVDQPNISKTEIFLHPESYAGQGWKDKVKLVKATLEQKGLDAVLLTSSASICWLLNIRGRDVPYTPLSLCYAIVHCSGHIDLFVYLENVTEEIRRHFGSRVTIHKLSGIDLAEKLPQILTNLRVGYTEQQAPMNVRNIMAPIVTELKNMEDPCALHRECKNKIQLNHIESVHEEDGIALVKFFCWLDENYKKGKITEAEAAEKIDLLRKENKTFQGFSFPTISGTAQNASIVHYRAGKNSLTLKEGDLFLCDSGGQYWGGTTDVTRTVCLGKSPTPKKKELYTRVLKGLIALSSAKFPEGTVGCQLDTLARKALWDLGYDYAHATGHGVGQFSNVHEGTRSISPRATRGDLKVGMVFSNEPGCYISGDFGIRIENLMFVYDTKEVDIFNRKILGFQTITLCPIDKSCIEKSLLSREKTIFFLNFSI